MIYYISDTHFGDKRIMKLSKRPFNNVKEMNDVIVRNWNAKVNSNDIIYIVGDFAVSDEVAKEIFSKLKGQKILILGNHDNVLKEDTLKMFNQVDKLLTITDEDRSVCLCHYPMLSFENSIYGGYQVFGHIHNNTKDVAYILEKQISNIFNCGVDENNFMPVTLTELINKKENKAL